MDSKKIKKAGTFVLNNEEAFHRWYKYLEGYSSCLIEEELDKLNNENIQAVYDPFCGTGTTSLVASQRGYLSYYSETNPFMQMVINAKINCVKNLYDSGIGSKYISKFINNLKIDDKYDEFDQICYSKFFKPEVLFLLIKIKEKINLVDDKDSKEILMVALSSIVVQVSKMIRRGDLRVAKENEKKPEDFDVLSLFTKKVEAIIEDIDNYSSSVKEHTIKIADDARDININNAIDCIITSPPYLNGTNYIRNTKLELFLNEFLSNEDELASFHSKGIIAGINNVSKKNNDFEILPIVKPFFDELEKVSYDRRIPLMVAGYFSDMKKVIIKLAQALRDGGHFIMDIGDSQFAGVHIPTHDILSSICEEAGFTKYAEEILRERKSKNGMVLSQRLLKFTISKPIDNNFVKKAKEFVNNMPYKIPPYNGRNWGHSWHSLCSYHGKLKPAIAYNLIKEFTKEGDIVLDPMCGVGTIPFEACLQGRTGIGNDLSELAYIVTKAKVNKPQKDDVIERLSYLEKYINENKNSVDTFNDIEKYSDFGFNGKVSTYFHEETYKEILTLRRFFIGKINDLSDVDCIIYSAFLHVLHGNRPYALSRNSHPLTPYAPKGELVYKNVIKHIFDKIQASYDESNFENYISGEAILGDFSNLNVSNVDFVITSPPFADSIRFYMQNWMRLWLCGWEIQNFKNADTVFIDQKQKKDFSVYLPFFEMCNRVLKPNGKIILHLGKTQKIDMAQEIMKYIEPYFKVAYLGTEEVSDIEKHGIKDKGATIEHEFLFIERK